MNIKDFAQYAAKFLVALTAALGVAAFALEDNVITTSEWVQIAIAFLGAAGVYVVPNKSEEEL